MHEPNLCSTNKGYSTTWQNARSVWSPSPRIHSPVGTHSAPTACWISCMEQQQRRNQWSGGGEGWGMWGMRPCSDTAKATIWKERNEISPAKEGNEPSWSQTVTLWGRAWQPLWRWRIDWGRCGGLWVRAKNMPFSSWQHWVTSGVLEKQTWWRWRDFSSGSSISCLDLAHSALRRWFPLVSLSIQSYIWTSLSLRSTGH